MTIAAIVITVATIACIPARRPKTVSVSWLPGLLSDLSVTDAQTVKELAFGLISHGIEQLGIPVLRGSTGFYGIQILDEARPSRRKHGGGAVLGYGNYETRQADVYYGAVRRSITSRGFGGSAEALGNAIGWVGVHEFGHLVIEDSDDYHQSFDPNGYNSATVDGGLGTANLVMGLGYWPSDVKQELITRLR